MSQVIIRGNDQLQVSIGPRGVILPNSFAEAFDFFQDANRSRDLRPQSIREYEYKILPFLSYLYGKGVSSLDDVKPLHVMGFINSLVTNNATSKKCYFTDIKRFFRWCQNMGIVAWNPMDKMESPKKSPSKSKPLTVEEMGRVMECAAIAGSPLVAARNLALIYCFLDGMLRVGEMAGLTIDDVHFDTVKVGGKAQSMGTIRVRDSKSRRARTVGIGGRTVLLLRQYLVRRNKYQGTDNLWAYLEEGALKPLSKKQLQNVVAFILCQAGVKTKKGPHTLRHTGASLCVQMGTDLETIRRKLGHSSLNMTQIYVQGLGDEDTATRQALQSPLDRIGGK